MLLASPQTMCYSYGYMYTCVHRSRTWNILADVPLQLQSLFMTVLSNFNIYKLTTNNIAIAMAQSPNERWFNHIDTLDIKKYNFGHALIISFVFAKDAIACSIQFIFLLFNLFASVTIAVIGYTTIE